jgi:MFS family permease
MEGKGSLNEETAVAAESSAGRGVLPTIFLTVFIDLIGFAIIFPLFPAMLDYYLPREESGGMLHALIENLRSISGTESQVAVLFGGILGSLYSTLQFFFAPLWGSLSDRTGRRPVLVVTIAGITASYALWFFSGSFALLVAARVLGGVMSGNISVATAAIADVTTPRNRARGMALVGIAFGLGFTIGPAIGAGLSGIDLTRHAPALAHWGVNPFSAAAAGALILSLANLFWVLRRFPETLGAAERGKARSVERSSNIVKLFAPKEYPGVNRANLVYFFFFLAYSGMEFTLVFLAAERFAFTPRDNAFLFVFVGILMALIQGGVVRRLAPRLGEKNLTLAGFALLLPGFLLTGFATSPAMLYLGLGFLAAGGALVTPCLSALVSLYTPADRQGEVLGIFRSLGALARAVGPVIACLVYWRFGSSAPYVWSAAWLLLPIALSVRLPEPRRAGGGATAGPP